MKQCKTLPFMFLRSMFVLFLSCLSVNTLGQSLTVSGTVTDEKGEPIIGASVLVIGTTNGSITNFDGIFTLNNVASIAQITISYIGMKSQTLSVNGKTSFKINTWREDKFERSVANGTETVFVTLRFCVVRKQLKATLKPNAAGVQLPPHYYRNG